MNLYYYYIIQGDSPSTLSHFILLNNAVIKIVEFFVLLKEWPVEIPNYNKHLFFKLEAPHSIVNYLENNFTENVDVSKSKFQREVFELFNFVRRWYDIDPPSRVWNTWARFKTRNSYRNRLLKTQCL